MQRVLQNLAFARLSREEAVTFQPEHVVHLFSLAQLCMQYLVYTQDVLAGTLEETRRQLLHEESKRASKERDYQVTKDQMKQLKKDVKK